MLKGETMARCSASDALATGLRGLPLKLDRLTLRPPTFDDVKPMFNRWATDPEVARYLIWAPHKSDVETHQFLSWAIDQWSTGPEYCWMICPHCSSDPVGTISLRDEGYKASVGFALSRAFWNRGFVSEAAFALIALAFSSGRIHRVSGVCDVDNHASAAVMQKVGMTLEGRLRSWLVHPVLGSTPRDCLSFSITKDDWKLHARN
ncbi:GNAT family N-acetyltransferase [Bradyrhizobium sp.]|jgi:[ribosomal protein S5]-alanine N-acetyltransferase|uniref:GNAT family N-acetyltransferase n=2 Tax=Nitrobacteraceae TaxID=41294 RepID=A0ABS5G289_9BRAD|nr:GNAT family N-acetyltransferase [Bradyrhizobium denitrificans]NPU24387.1 GNAT family N-acetyltransferase [Bradyrhizobium sp. LMG 8443]